MYSVSLMTKGSCTIRMVHGHYLYLATRDCLSLVTEYCAYHLLKVETRRNTKLITILRIVVNYINNSLPYRQVSDLGLTSRLVVYSDDCFLIVFVIVIVIIPALISAICSVITDITVGLLSSLVLLLQQRRCCCCRCFLVE